MTDEEFDECINSLQEKFFAEAFNAYGEKGFERWRSPRYHGRLENVDGFGRVTGDRGDTIEMFLKIENNSIIEASYMTTG